MSFEIPIRRLKKASASLAFPKENSPARSRKNSRFFQHPSVRRDPALAAVHPFPVPVVQRVGFVRNQRVTLSTEGVQLEDVGVPPVVVRI